MQKFFNLTGHAQYTYYVTLRRVRVTTVAEKKKLSITYSECVSVALVIQHSRRLTRYTRAVQVTPGLLSLYKKISKMQNIREWLCPLFPKKDSSLVQFHDRLCVDYPGSGVTALWMFTGMAAVWAGNHHGRDRHWQTYGPLWHIYTIRMSYCGWASRHRTAPEVFCRYPRGFTSSFGRNFITTRCSVHALTLLSAILINPSTPNDPYRGHTTPLTSKRCILYIYPTNIGTEYIKYIIYSPFFSLYKMQFVS